MKFISTIYELKNLEKISKYTAGFVVGLKSFSTSETALFTFAEFKAISKFCKANNKELFISLKPLLHNSQIESLTISFKLIKDLYYSGVIVGDRGYYYLLKELGIKNIIYNPETLLTNVFDVNEVFRSGMSGAVIAKEISLKDLKEIIKNKEGQLFIVGHGHLKMFYSKRALLKNYFSKIAFQYDYNKDTIRLKEKSRESLYPIIEDEFGTHIFRSEVSTTLYNLAELKGIDYLIIDSIFHDDDYAYEVLKLFKEGPNKTKIEDLKNKYNEQWDSGFLFTKTIYKRD